MTFNPKYNKILAEALAKADAQKDFIPMSVIEDIKTELNDTVIFVQYSIPKDHNTDDIANMVEDIIRQVRKSVINLIDKHISRKEQNNE